MSDYLEMTKQLEMMEKFVVITEFEVCLAVFLCSQLTNSMRRIPFFSLPFFLFLCEVLLSSTQGSVTGPRPEPYESSLHDSI